MKYFDLLPDYLGGPNIQKHANIIDHADNELKNNLDILSKWCSLDRVILVERNTTPELLYYTIHVQTSNPILKIVVDGDFYNEYTFNAADNITEYLINVTFNNNNLTDANFIVSVTDSEENQYSKGYPENDLPAGNIYDHDEFIDRIGALLGVPRKNYLEYNYTDGLHAKPEYAGKAVTNGVVQACTEDDYYYLQRIKEYLEHFNNTPLTVLMAQLIYGCGHAKIVTTENLYHDKVDGYYKYIAYMVENDIEYLIQQEGITKADILIIGSADTPVNYDSLNQNQLKEFFSKYLPITRRIYILPNMESAVDITLTPENNPDYTLGDEHKLYPKFYTKISKGNNTLTGLLLGKYLLNILVDNTEYQQVLTKIPNSLGDELTGSFISTELLDIGLHQAIIRYDGEEFYNKSLKKYYFKYILDDYTVNTTLPDVMAGIFNPDVEWKKGDWIHIYTNGSLTDVGISNDVTTFDGTIGSLSSFSRFTDYNVRVLSLEYMGDRAIVNNKYTLKANGYTFNGNAGWFLINKDDNTPVEITAIRTSHYTAKTYNATYAVSGLEYTTLNENLLSKQYNVQVTSNITELTYNNQKRRIIFGYMENGNPSNTVYGLNVTLEDLGIQPGLHEFLYKCTGDLVYLYVDGVKTDYSFNLHTNELIYNNTVTQMPDFTWNLMPTVYITGTQNNNKIITVLTAPDTDLLETSVIERGYTDTYISVNCDIDTLNYDEVIGTDVTLNILAQDEQGNNLPQCEVIIYKGNAELGKVVTDNNGAATFTNTLTRADAELTGINYNVKALQGRVYAESSTAQHTITVTESPLLYQLSLQSVIINYAGVEVESMPCNRFKDATYTLTALLLDRRTNQPIPNQPVDLRYKYSLFVHTITTVNTDENGIARATISGANLQNISVSDTNIRFNARVLSDNTWINSNDISIPLTETEPYTTSINLTSLISSLNYSTMNNTIITLQGTLINTEKNAPIPHADVTLKLGDTLIQTLTTDASGQVTYDYTTVQTLNNLIFTLEYDDPNTIPTYASATGTTTVTVIDDRTNLNLTAVPNTIPANWINYMQIQLTGTLTDGTGNPLPAGQIITVLYPDTTSYNYSTGANGQIHVEYTLPAGNYDNQGVAIEANYPGTNRYASATAYGTIGFTPAHLMGTAMTVDSDISGNTIQRADLTTQRIELTASLMTNDSYFSTPQPVKNKTITVKQWDDDNEGVTLGTITTNNYGGGGLILNGLHDTTDTQIELEFTTTSDSLYNYTSESLFITIQGSAGVAPLADELLFNINNWGTYPSGTSGSSQSGALTPATTSDMTIDLTDKTLTDRNQKYFVYNKTLNDFFNYYGDEFSLIAYKTGGDGRYHLGFVDTTNGKKLGYIDGKATNEAASISASLGEVVYQKYNQITFKKEGTDITLYWKQGGTNYVSRTMTMGNIDPTKYYLYWRSTVRSGFTLTNDETKIDHKSRPE